MTWEPCPPDNTHSCSFCLNPKSAHPWSWHRFKLIACICLKERPDRFESSTVEFHRIGLCQHVQYYRPTKPDPKYVRSLGFQRVAAYGSWNSHREIACNALRMGFWKKNEYALMMEDDCQYLDNFTPERLLSIHAQIESLPENWEIFYLGHFPLPFPWTNYPTLNDPFVWKTSSAMLHSYILSERGAQRLANAPYHAYASHLLGFRLPFVQSEQTAEYFLDDWTRENLRGYATVPMVAVQRDSVSDQIVVGKEIGIALHHRIAKYWPGAIELCTMIIPFLCLVFGIIIFAVWVLYSAFSLVTTLDEEREEGEEEDEDVEEDDQDIRRRWMPSFRSQRTEIPLDSS